MIQVFLRHLFFVVNIISEAFVFLNCEIWEKAILPNVFAVSNLYDCPRIIKKQVED